MHTTITLGLKRILNPGISDGSLVARGGTFSQTNIVHTISSIPTVSYDHQEI